MTLSSIWPPRTIVAKRSCTEATSRLFFPFVNVPLGTFCLITSLILTKMLDLTADYKLRENEKKKKEKKRKKRNDITFTSEVMSQRSTGEVSLLPSQSGVLVTLRTEGEQVL